MIYIYVAICISMIAFNCVYVFIIRHSEERLEKHSYEYDVIIREQLRCIDSGMEVSDEHKKYLCMKLKYTPNLTAFDKTMENLYAENPEKALRYLSEIYSVFIYLTMEYFDRDTIKSAYFPYIVGKYNILKLKDSNVISEIMFKLLRSDNVYCRENALGAIYSAGKSELAVRALKIIDSNGSFHHPKLVCDGLLSFEGNREELCEKLWSCFNEYSEKMQVNILNFFRFAGIRCDEEMCAVLNDEDKNQELRFAAIRYFEKFPCEKVRDALQNFAENKAQRIWEYQAIASSALKSYPGDKTTEILKKNLSDSNWYVRLNSAISCEKLGFTYSDLIQVFDGDDRYAREMLRYRFDRRKAEKEVAQI